MPPEMSRKEETRLKMVNAASRGFRKQGLNGIGVDGLAKEAEVTHGAFYGHFRSKAEAFKAAVTAGIGELNNGILATREKHREGWVKQFVAFYLGHKRTCSLADACTIPVLSPEIERTDPGTRAAYEAELLKVVHSLSSGFEAGSPAEREARAWVFLALLSGGVTLARAVPSVDLSVSISKAVSKYALRVAAAQ